MRNCFFFIFFPRLGFTELFYWAASRQWGCFYTGQSPDVQSPKAKSTGKSGGVTSPAGCATMPAWLQKELQHTERFRLCLSFLIFLIFEDPCEEEAGLSAIEHVLAASFAWWHRVAAS